MKSLEQHNSERQELNRTILDAAKPHPNGIACPNCGKELWDTNPDMVLLSNPPKKNIHCESCNYRGYA